MPVMTRLALLAIVACLHGAAASASDTSGMLNPAAVKCIEDGYEIEDILTRGVPTGAWCVEPQTGERCEIWAYFRSECVLPLVNEADEKEK